MFFLDLVSKSSEKERRKRRNALTLGGLKKEKGVLQL